MPDDSAQDVGSDSPPEQQSDALAQEQREQTTRTAMYDALTKALEEGQSRSKNPTGGK
jgi:hypothetical protein